MVKNNIFIEDKTGRYHAAELDDYNNFPYIISFILEKYKCTNCGLFSSLDKGKMYIKTVKNKTSDSTLIYVYSKNSPLMSWMYNSNYYSDKYWYHWCDSDYKWHIAESTSKNITLMKEPKIY